MAIEQLLKGAMTPVTAPYRAISGAVSSLIDPTQRTKSLRHAAFLAFCVASIFWLTRDLYVRRKITQTWVGVYGIFAGACVISKVSKQGQVIPPTTQAEKEDDSDANPPAA